MHGLLAKLLKKRGIKSFSELDDSPMPDNSPTEKQKWDEWEKILSKEELTLEDVKQFCRSQIDVIEGKWKDLNTDQSKKAEFIPYHTVYKTLLQAIDSPRSSRESLEQQLNQLLK